MESPRERCEEPDCMCSENCIVWTSNWAQTPINVVSSPLPCFCRNIFVSSFLTKFHSRFLTFFSLHFQTKKTFSNVLLFSFENVFPWSLESQKTCSFLLGRISLFLFFWFFQESCLLFSFISKALTETSACFKIYFYLFRWFFLQICRFCACLSFLSAFDEKKVFFFVFILVCFGTFSFLFSFLNICFFIGFSFLLSFLNVSPFWRFSLIWLSFFCPFFILLLLHTFLSFWKKPRFSVWFPFLLSLFFLNERNGSVFPLHEENFVICKFVLTLFETSVFFFYSSLSHPPIQHFAFFECLCCLFNSSLCSLFFCLSVFFLAFIAISIFYFSLLLDCLFVFFISNLSSQFFKSL